MTTPKTTDMHPMIQMMAELISVVTVIECGDACEALGDLEFDQPHMMACRVVDGRTLVTSLAVSPRMGAELYAKAAMIYLFQRAFERGQISTMNFLKTLESELSL